LAMLTAFVAVTPALGIGGTSSSLEKSHGSPNVSVAKSPLVDSDDGGDGIEPNGTRSVSAARAGTATSSDATTEASAARPMIDLGWFVLTTHLT